ncbi:hypothetical protein V496_05343 [Pseudogymnoascus sp. VKM F-4515 (FW-2607)]|nr:hypothetical protein V496_05343 [Pseudogymnoascus sp. VKM F-4515 (FW-2607)]
MQGSARKGAAHAQGQHTQRSSPRTGATHAKEKSMKQKYPTQPRGRCAHKIEFESALLTQLTLEPLLLLLTTGKESANEWATFGGPFTDTKGSSGTENPCAQKDDPDILATCQTPASLTPFWQARYEEAAGKPPNDDEIAHMRDAILDIPVCGSSQVPGTFRCAAPPQDRQDLDIEGPRP